MSRKPQEEDRLHVALQAAMERVIHGGNVALKLLQDEECSTEALAAMLGDLTDCADTLDEVNDALAGDFEESE